MGNTITPTKSEVDNAKSGVIIQLIGNSSQFANLTYDQVIAKLKELDLESFVNNQAQVIAAQYAYIHHMHRILHKDGGPEVRQAYY